MAKKSGLGRGLGALLGEPEGNLPGQVQTISVLPLRKIEPNPLQPRKDFDPEALQALADSITAHGVIQPLTVREAADGYYQIIAGERRWRAARLAGLDEIPAIVRDWDEVKRLEAALIENLQRDDLNPIEEAQGFRTLMEEYGLTQEQAAQRVGKSRPAVANSLRLLSLDSELTELVRDGVLSPGHARALLGLKNEKQRRQAAQRVIALQLSVRQTETLCKNMEKPVEKPVQAPDGVDYVGDCERQLTRRLQRKVKIVPGKRKGHIEIDFYGDDDLNRLIDTLMASKIKE